MGVIEESTGKEASLGRSGASGLCAWLVVLLLARPEGVDIAAHSGCKDSECDQSGKPITVSGIDSALGPSRQQKV